MMQNKTRMTQVKIYCLFERRKSAAHKWNLVHDYENVVPEKSDEICRFNLFPSKWNEHSSDEIAMYLLANLVSIEKSIEKNLPFANDLQQFVAKTTNLCYLRNLNYSATNLSKKTQSLIKELSVKEKLVSQICLHLQELYEFFNDLEEQHEAKIKHRLLRLLFRHMQVKLCTLNYPEVRVHLLTTFDSSEKEIQVMSVAKKIIDFSDLNTSIPTNDSSTKTLTDDLITTNLTNDSSTTTPTGDSQCKSSTIEIKDCIYTEEKTSNKFEEQQKSEEIREIKGNNQIIDKPVENYELNRKLSNVEDAKDTRKALVTTDTYDFNGDGWDIEKINLSAIDKTQEIYLPLPSFEDLLDPSTKEDNINMLNKASQQQNSSSLPKKESIVVVAPETDPKTFSLPEKSILLAVSEVKEETRSITKWIYEKLSATYGKKKNSLCFISQNFSKAECTNVQQFVTEKQQNNELVTIGVECEFLPLDPSSRECTTLLNEFDSLTSLLILEFILMPHVTIVFETTKPFNQVWCWKYNLINTQSSHWFTKASQTNDYASFLSQKQAHSAAMIRLVMSASNQAASLVRCTNLTPTQKETYFDMVILGCNANCNETQHLFDFVNNQCSAQKLDSARWKKRIANLNIGDALAIPISIRNNDFQYDLCCKFETEKQIAIAGAAGAMLNQRVGFRAPISTIPFMQSIPKPSSYAFLSNSIKTDYQFGDPYILKNVNQK